MRYLLLCLLVACSSNPPHPAPLPGERVAARELTPAERMELARRVHQRAVGHTKLDALEGNWQVSLTSQLADGSATELLGEGRAAIRWIMDRHFLEWKLELDVQGRPHHVGGFLGYDVLLQEYQALWISELTTGMSLARGDGDPEGHGLILQVRASQSGEVAGARSLLRILDRNHFVIESIAQDARGQEGVVQRASYTRIP